MECLLDADTSWMARWHGVPPELISHCKTVKQAAATVIKAGLYGRDGKPEGGRSEYDASRTLAASFLQWRKQDGNSQAPPLDGRVELPKQQVTENRWTTSD